jgi:hypothetical protein
MTSLCSFCWKPSRLEYKRVDFCSWHMIWLYLGLELEWTD